MLVTLPWAFIRWPDWGKRCHPKKRFNFIREKIAEPRIYDRLHQLVCTDLLRPRLRIYCVGLKSLREFTHSQFPVNVAIIVFGTLIWYRRCRWSQNYGNNVKKAHYRTINICVCYQRALKRLPLAVTHASNLERTRPDSLFKHKIA